MWFFISLFLLYARTASADETFAIKNNLVYDAVATPNLQFEARLAKQWTLEIGAGFNPFPLDDTKFPKWRHVMVSLAPRYWLEEVFRGHFVSVNVAYTHYNVAGGVYPIGWLYAQVKDNRYQGDAVMAGISYGYNFPIVKHFSIELEAGIDAGYSWYSQFECKHCGNKVAQGGRWFLLPKLAVNLVVPFGIDHRSLEKPCNCELIDEISEPVVPQDTAVVPAPQDTVAETPAPQDTVEAPAPQDTVVAPILLDTVPAPVVPSEPTREEQIQIVTENISTVVENVEEVYVPYTEEIALSADPRSTFFYFDVDATHMDSTVIQNDVLMSSLRYLIEDGVTNPTLRITRIQIVGLASFDGRLGYNRRLAGKRANTIKEFIQSIYPLDDSLFDLSNGGENWAELKYMTSQMEFEGKDEVLEIIDSEPDLDKREARIKQLNDGRTYTFIRDNMHQAMRSLGFITVYFERVKQ